MIKFIGSVYFALILIATVALVVVAGTFLESYTSSHLFAARFTYGNPLFGILLWLFFLNIFVSTLLRWPFKKHHIPFIITHCGLLMILGGQLVKHYSGTQGVMQLSEGCSSCEYFTEHSQALQLTDREGSTTIYPIQNYKVDAPHIKIVSYHPNGSESLKGWIFQGKAWLTGLPPIPVETWEIDAPIPKGSLARLHHSSSTPWHLFAVKTTQLEALQNKLTPYQPYVVFLDGETPEAIWVSAGGSTHRQLLDPSLSVAMYDEGFGGYTTTIEIPFSNLPDTIETQRDALIYSLSVQLRIQRDLVDQLSPPLKHLYEATEKAKANFVETAIAFFDQWDRTGEYLYMEPKGPAHLLESLQVLDTNALIALLEQFAPEIAKPAQKLSAAGLLSICCKAYGLELKKFNPPDKNQLLQEYYAASMFSSKVLEALPKTAKWSLDERVSYLQAFPIDAEDLYSLRKYYVAYLQAVSPDLNIPDNYTPSLAEIIDGIRLLTPLSPPKYSAVPEDFPSEKPRLESPLFPKRKAEPEKIKLEEHRPIVTFEIAGEPPEKFTLVYDPLGNGLQWPIQGGKLLARFQPHFEKLPHTLKLLQARQINYANTSQPYSFEADLWIEPGHIFVPLSMNQVHETDDGFRFYLSGISPTDPGAWKKIQLVINKDPGKYWLTYPGALILLLGALLLFFRRRTVI